MRTDRYDVYILFLHRYLCRKGVRRINRDLRLMSASMMWNWKGATMFGYGACIDAVMAGRRVTLAVQTYASTEFYCESIPGKENGVYDCWLQVEGLDHPMPFFKLQQPPNMEAMPKEVK